MRLQEPCTLEICCTLYAGGGVMVLRTVIPRMGPCGKLHLHAHENSTITPIQHDTTTFSFTACADNSLDCVGVRALVLHKLEIGKLQFDVGARFRLFTCPHMDACKCIPRHMCIDVGKFAGLPLHRMLCPLFQQTPVQDGCSRPHEEVNK